MHRVQRLEQNFRIRILETFVEPVEDGHEKLNGCVGFEFAELLEFFDAVQTVAKIGAADLLGQFTDLFRLVGRVHLANG